MDLLTFSLIVPFLTAPFALLLNRIPRISGIVSTISVMFSTISSLFYINHTGPINVYSFKIFGIIPINLDFYLNSLSWLLWFIVSFVGSMCLLYSITYMIDDRSPGRYYFWMLLFIGGGIGVALTNNTIFLAMFWEITTISSFALIGHWTDKNDSLFGSIKALLITSIGGISIILFAILSYVFLDTTSIDRIISNFGSLGEFYKNILLFLLLSASLTKSAQFPFNSWLPDAMAAPTPVSALLHAAAMVKLGVFLFAKFLILFTYSPFWLFLILILTTISIVYGAIYANAQSDMKRILAYSTISQLGYMFLAFSIGGIAYYNNLYFVSSLAYLAGMFHMLNHAMFKASLFLGSGIVEHKTHTRNIEHLGGLSRYLPFTSFAFTVSSLSLIGIPIFNGFVSKWLIYQSITGSIVDFPYGQLFSLVLICAMAGTIFTFLYSMKMLNGVFYGVPRKYEIVNDGKGTEIFPVLLMSSLCILFGIYPNIVLPVFVTTPFTNSLHFNYYSIPGFFSSFSALYTFLVITSALLVGYAFYRTNRSRISETFTAGEKKEVLANGGDYISSNGFIFEIKNSVRNVGEYFDADRFYYSISKLMDRFSTKIRMVHTGSLTFYLSWIVIMLIILLGVVL